MIFSQEKSLGWRHGILGRRRKTIPMRRKCILWRHAQETGRHAKILWRHKMPWRHPEMILWRLPTLFSWEKMIPAGCSSPPRPTAFRRLSGGRSAW
jgi:hypothetical protein